MNKHEDAPWRGLVEEEKKRLGAGEYGIWILKFKLEEKRGGSFGKLIIRIVCGVN